MPLRSILVALSCFVPACAGPTEAGPVAPVGDFEAATARAADEEKLLLIDFHSPGRRWYGPEEKAPWRDEAVREWIDEHAVAIQLDPTKDLEITSRFGIESPPILVFLRDGVELDRHTDFQSAAGFLDWAEGVRRGRTRKQRLDDEMRELAEGRAMGLWYYATKLVREGSFDDATEALIKAWDMTRHEQQAAESYVGVLSHQTRELAEQHPPARTAFERLLAETELRTFGSDPPRSFDFMQWLELCVALGKEQRVVSWFEQTRDEDGLLYGRFFPPSAAAYERSQFANEQALKVRMLVQEFLIDQRRFDDAAELYEDPAGWARVVSFSARLGRVVFAGVALTADESSFMRDYPQTIADARLREVAKIHAVTLAAGRAEQADQVAHLLLDDDETGLGRVALVKAALDLDTTPPADAARWLEEAKARGADTEKVQSQLAKAAAAQPK